ncbi:hypothetical protein DASC09_041820 [Saccharomycopsis crataegensis]|uniref:Uncharacterized protein n=1 Tax=Saccharomycopsis crataegensis TaxID=43959 RepID=A0AAV5QQH1_9ASCO|nr:hypothetical protein DASC09_041820 [Saccharomycopsis crataegensis]
MSGGPVPVYKKYTTGSKGIWEILRQWLTLVPNRSSGNPIVPLYRAVPPGSQPKAPLYTDPFTIPTGDIKANPFYKRDHRRNYPQISSFDQTKISGLLTLGSVSNPRISIGNKGQEELLPFKASNDETLLSKTLPTVSRKVIQEEILGAQNSAIVAPSLTRKRTWVIVPEAKNGIYGPEFPCRLFNTVPVQNA